MIPHQFLGESYYRMLLDAMPLMVLVVDDDVCILDMNRAAEEALGGDKSRLTQQRGGEVLQCVHAWDVPEGCGKGPHCSSCAVRNSVRGCYMGKESRRRRAKFRITTETGEKDVELLITSTQFMYEGNTQALLILEDISELTTLRKLIPICAKCKKIRGDDEYWKNVENYFNDYLGVDFTHGLCPDCVQDFIADWSKSGSARGIAAPTTTSGLHSSPRRSPRS